MPEMKALQNNSARLIDFQLLLEPARSPDNKTPGVPKVKRVVLIPGEITEVTAEELEKLKKIKMFTACLEDGRITCLTEAAAKRKKKAAETDFME